MRKILNRDIFHEPCPHCGLSPMDYLIYHLRFLCMTCLNGTRRPGEVDGPHCEDVHRHGSRS